MLIPTAPSPAPNRNASGEAMRDRVLQLTALAGMTGSPQVSLPWTDLAGVPLGLSVMGPPGTDEGILEVLQEVAREG